MALQDGVSAPAEIIVGLASDRDQMQRTRGVRLRKTGAERLLGEAEEIGIEPAAKAAVGTDHDHEHPRIRDRCFQQG